MKEKVGEKKDRGNGENVQKEINVERKKERIKEITRGTFNRRPTACFPGGSLYLEWIGEGYWAGARGGAGLRLGVGSPSKQV